jgi:RNA 3'-phosphate cyclase
MIEIDGSYKEGGGQVLRTSIALASLLGRPLKIVNIRANRPKPGLKQQHLAGVRAICEMTGAKAEGLEIGSKKLDFFPGKKHPKSCKIDVKTAGSISLVLQTVLLPCIFSKEVVNIEITGGTDVKWSPSINYFKNVFLGVVRRMGVAVDMDVMGRGYYPKGGGRVRMTITPVERLERLMLLKREDPVSVDGVAHSQNLPSHIVEREIKGVREILKEARISPEYGKGVSTGTGIDLWAVYENTVLGAGDLGERGKPAEKVGRTAGRRLMAEIKSGAAADTHLSDQILPFMALADGESIIKTAGLSNHFKTNRYIVERILGNRFEITITNDGNYVIRTRGVGFHVEQGDE